MEMEKRMLSLAIDGRCDEVIVAQTGVCLVGLLLNVAAGTTVSIQG